MWVEQDLFLYCVNLDIPQGVKDAVAHIDHALIQFFQTKIYHGIDETEQAMHDHRFGHFYLDQKEQVVQNSQCHYTRALMMHPFDRRGGNRARRDEQTKDLPLDEVFLLATQLFPVASYGHLLYQKAKTILSTPPLLKDTIAAEQYNKAQWFVKLYNNMLSPQPLRGPSFDVKKCHEQHFLQMVLFKHYYSDQYINPETFMQYMALLNNNNIAMLGHDEQMKMFYDEEKRVSLFLSQDSQEIPLISTTPTAPTTATITVPRQSFKNITPNGISAPVWLNHNYYKDVVIDEDTLLTQQPLAQKNVFQRLFLNQHSLLPTEVKGDILINVITHGASMGALLQYDAECQNTIFIDNNNKNKNNENNNNENNHNILYQPTIKHYCDESVACWGYAIHCYEYVEHFNASLGGVYVLEQYRQQHASNHHLFYRFEGDSLMQDIFNAKYSFYKPLWDDNNNNNNMSNDVDDEQINNNNNIYKKSC